MTKRRIIFTALILAGIGALIYSQVRTWRRFDWTNFWAQTSGVNPWLLIAGTGAIYCTYLLRAVRWKVFLRPVRHARARDLISPTMIGFTGLALLGRPGELVRPYLIGRREQLSTPSQIGVWAVERIFDLGAFTVLLTLDIFTSTQLRDLEYFGRIREAGFALAGLTAVLALSAFFVWRSTETVAYYLCRIFSPLSPKFAHSVEHKIRTFGQGLHTLRNFRSFLEALGLSMLIWLSVGLAYLLVANAYPPISIPSDPVIGLQVLPHQMKFAHVFPLIASSMAGSLIQLPAVGGGSQLAVIAVLIAVFQVPRELAVSCGILLWLITFMACIPVGLLLAHHEHISLRKLSHETEEEEKREAAAEYDSQAEPGHVGD